MLLGVAMIVWYLRDLACLCVCVAGVAGAGCVGIQGCYSCLGTVLPLVPGGNEWTFIGRKAARTNELKSAMGALRTLLLFFVPHFNMNKHKSKPHVDFQ